MYSGPPPPAGGFGAAPYPPQPSFPPPTAPLPPKKTSGCLTAILIALVVGVPAIGVLSVTAIYGVRKYIANAKTAEARITLVQLGKLSQQAYLRDGQLCPSAPRAVPADMNDVGGRKYQSRAADWAQDDPKAGFACLGFSMALPQYFQYSYTSVPGVSFSAKAHGDLNGDGERSTFELTGQLVNGKLVISPTIREESPEE